MRRMVQMMRLAQLDSLYQTQTCIQEKELYKQET
jgi:hypothetical protein